MTEEHSSPIKTPKQLIVVVLLAFAVPIALAVLLSQLVTSGKQGTQDSENGVLARIAPVGSVVLAEVSGPKGMLTGEQVYGQVCKTCHEGGLAGAPKLGDKAGWAKVVAQGEKLTYEHAINGIRAMPARGGNGDLTDDEVKRAAAFMLAKVGTNWTAPAVAAAPAAGGATERTGKQVVEAACAKCHDTGVGGAPKIGDRAAWLSRVKSGLDKVHQSALRGHAGMPARGGMADLSDNEVKKAVEFMLNSGVIPAAVAAPVAATAPAVVAAAPAADGRKVYDAGCVACHGAGVAGAPKFGDKAAWAPRIKTGIDALYAASIKGKGVMPAKGGNASLSDADIRAAVDFMVAAAK